jgi:putative redox protein
MIIARSGDARYVTSFTNGRHTAYVDATADKGGSESGFRPHELLEAAFASCVNMWLRMYSDSHDVPLHAVVTTVQLDRTEPGAPKFQCQVEMDGPLTAEQREKLLAISDSCPVRRTLSGTISFSPSTTPGER